MLCSEVCIVYTVCGLIIHVYIGSEYFLPMCEKKQFHILMALVYVRKLISLKEVYL